MALAEQLKDLQRQTGSHTLNYSDLQTLARCRSCRNDA